MESLIKVNSGQIAVLGGLIEDSVNDIEDTIPIINAIPSSARCSARATATTPRPSSSFFCAPSSSRIRASTATRAFREMLPGENFISRPNPARRVARVLKMSLLLEALKKAELAKQVAKAQAPSPEPSPRRRTDRARDDPGEAADITQPLEILSDDLPSSETKAAERQRQGPSFAAGTGNVRARCAADPFDERIRTYC